MSAGKVDVAAVQPLVIIRRRRSSGEEAHHGGVWKIAYADFMTAMMAFFLVMWLVNAADKKTIVQVAAYFNPVRLTEKAPSSKGLDTLTAADQKKRKKSGGGATSEASDATDEGLEVKPIGKPETKTEQSGATADALSKSAGEARKEEALFSDPMGVLDKLAMKAAGQETVAQKTAPDGLALRDPFDPAHRNSADAPRISAPNNENASQVINKEDVRKDQKPAIKGKTAAAPVRPDVKLATQSGAERAAEKLAAELRAITSLAGQATPDVEVKVTPEGLLISLTDNSNFGMFAIGSAEPRPEVVGVLARIGEILKSREGNLIVRGHTDARTYKNANYDNWRLSAARAQMSYYMLVRGGADPERFSAIEGHADRDLKIPGNKEAAQNRRIEILIKSASP